MLEKFKPEFNNRESAVSKFATAVLEFQNIWKEIT